MLSQICHRRETRLTPVFNIVVAKIESSIGFAADTRASLIDRQLSAQMPEGFLQAVRDGVRMDGHGSADLSLREAFFKAKR